MYFETRFIAQLDVKRRLTVMPTAKDVAKWMLGQLEEHVELYQEDAVWEIQELFGEEFIYENENGNFAIGKNVLREFRKLTEENVVWERGTRLWRRRTEYDEPGRRQAD